MSVKNGVAHLQESIQSVLNQSFTDFDFWIVDDGSTDHSAALIQSFQDRRIHLIQQENTGVAAAKNRAIAASTGTYLAIIDADDLWLPHKLEEQVSFLQENPAYGLVGGYAQIIDEEGHYLYTEAKPTTHEENLRYNEIKNTWTHSAIVFSRKAFETVGGYYEPARQYLVDYMLVYQLSKVCKVFQLPKVIVKYRINPGGLSAKADGKAFHQLMHRAIRAGTMNDEDLAQLQKIKTQEDGSPHFKESMYHLYLGRSYLLHNYQPQRSQHHLKQSLALNPNLKIARYYLLMLKTLPRFVLRFLYRTLSPNAGFTFVEE